MRIYLTMAFLLVLAIPVSGRAQCPEEMPDEGDWDGDGIINVDDPCCFTTSYWEDLSGDLCSEDFMSGDMNGNGISAVGEGNCCVVIATDSTNLTSLSVPTRSYCYQALIELTEAEGEEYCREGDVMVSCDMLLLYDGMIPYGEGQNVLECGEGGCICYTIGDYDKDDGFDEGGRDGPFDNCPGDWNTDETGDGQADADGDYFGDACDFCVGSMDSFFGEARDMGAEEFQLAFEDAQCEIGGDDCPGAVCVPRAIENPRVLNADGVSSQERILVGNFCSAPADGDEDAVGDACDNCVDVSNASQSDIDTDGVGDMCDACPTNALIIEQTPGMVNSDSDHVIDSCDNCPLIDNPEQLNHDGDVLGDVCDKCPYNGELGAAAMSDLDSDGFADVCDPCPRDAEITGTDPEYSALYPDADSDGYADVCDNCAAVTNGGQKDADGDGIGDSCDSDNSPSEPLSSESGAVSFSGGGVISCRYSPTQNHFAHGVGGSLFDLLF